MALLNAALGRRRDLPQIESYYLSTAAAAGADFEHVLCTVPRLADQQGIPAGYSSSLPINEMQVRLFYVVSEALVTGATATALTIAIRQWRAGSALGTIASLTTNTGTNLAAMTPVNIPLVGGPAELKAGDVLTVRTTHAGTGTAIGPALFQIDWSPWISQSGE